MRTANLKEWIGRKPKGEPVTIDYFFDRSIPEPNSGCWIWLNAMSARNGYGAMNLDGKTARAHRVAYEVHHSTKVDRHIDVCHSCDVRCCVNPDHLFLGSRKDNMRDCANKGRIKIPSLMGEQLTQSVLTEPQVLAIRASNKSQRAIAREYGVDKGTIAHIVHRKTWRHI